MPFPDLYRLVSREPQKHIDTSDGATNVSITDSGALVNRYQKKACLADLIMMLCCNAPDSVEGIQMDYFTSGASQTIRQPNVGTRELEEGEAYAALLLTVYSVSVPCCSQNISSSSQSLYCIVSGTEVIT